MDLEIVKGMIMRIFRFLTVCAIAVTLTGCACFNTVNSTNNRTTTMGQELIDLQKAKDTGAITEAEYETSKSKLMKLAEINTVTFEAQGNCSKSK